MTNQLQLAEWTFLSNHTHVLHCIFLWPGIRIRDIAAKVQITERAVQRIVVDLERGGYLKRKRVGRQNQYRLDFRRHLRHPLEHHVEVGRLLTALQSPGTAARETPVQGRLSPVVTRGLQAVSSPSRVGGKTISRLGKRRAKPRRLVAK